MNIKIDISGVILKTKRLILRPWRETDLEDFYAYASMDGLGQMAGWMPHRSIEESRGILASFIEGRHTLALEYEGRVVGSLGIDEYSEEDYPELDKLKGSELGYVLSKDLWGRGLMPEAVNAVISYLFDSLQLDFILAGHFDWNKQSARVIEKCGFHYIKNRPYKTRCGSIENSVESIIYRRYYSERRDYENDEELVRKIYSSIDESKRLTSTKAGRVEFLTNIRYIEKYLKPGAKILDVGAGAGEYSLYLARKGYDVTAVELAESNIQRFKSRLRGDTSIRLMQGNALDLSRFPDEAFDIVLVLGPLYHLHSEADQLRCIAQARRVCRKEGRLFFAFLSNDAVILTMFNEFPDYFLKGEYDKDSFRLVDFPFVFHTQAAAEKLLREGELEISNKVASEGLSELMKQKINAMDDESFSQYMKYHFYSCEKPGHLELSNHLLYVCSKRE